ncbi:33K [Titi monkey adenovirus ECC-2011]|uniref:33K n=1 Tax=titi monkey adenovirus 1 TaxID=3123084 RepID=G0ZAI8_9ADEN|nr:33K [Titi monkey adenovirus ECC-2011]AEK98460.1 33K [Titi monkey adenovirus ECC-2011]
MAPRKPAPAKKQPPPPPVHPIWEDDEEEYTEDEEDLLTDEEDMEGLEDIEEEDEEEDLDEDPQEEPREQAVADSQHLAPRAPQAAPAPSAAAAPSKSRTAATGPKSPRQPASSRKGKTSSSNSSRSKIPLRKTPATGSSSGEQGSTRALREKIFPTLYAIFQQGRGHSLDLKIKNRSLRSLTRSCLYHKSEDQLQRTLEDAEALFNKYCASTLPPLGDH